jgi:hypothetical protein
MNEGTIAAVSTAGENRNCDHSPFGPIRLPADAFSSRVPRCANRPHMRYGHILDPREIHRRVWPSVSKALTATPGKTWRNPLSRGTWLPGKTLESLSSWEHASPTGGSPPGF